MPRTLPGSPVEPSEPMPFPGASAGIDAEWLHEQRHLSLIIDSAPNGIILVDSDGAIELVNKQVEKMFGYQRSELLGRSVELLLPERFREHHPDVRRGYHDRPSARAMGAGRDLFGRRSDGSEFPLEIGLNPIPTSAGTWVLGSVVDITERKLVEAKLRETVRLKSEFLANMSHEIRTPMNVIIGMSSLMLETELTSEQREFAEVISSGAESLLTIINDILDFSKIEAGKLEIHVQEFDLNATVEEAAGFLAEAAGRKGVEMTCRSGPEMPPVLGDAMRIRQVLVNILGNAVKFTEKGEINLTMTCAPAGASGLQARFEIQDSGIGMSVQTLDRLFEAFSQGDGSHTRRYGGTGLGLAISKKLVDLMGGSIGGRSKLGEGSTFWFTIPLEIRAGEVYEQPALHTSLHGCRALVIDDNQNNRSILAAQLGNWSMEVTTANDAVDGLTLLRAAHADRQPYDVILLDFKMPGINGLDLARILRADPALASTPIFLLTSHVGRKTHAEAKQAGVDVQMTKPVRSRHLREALTGFLTAPRRVAAVAGAHGVMARGVTAAEDRSPMRNSPVLLLVEDNAGNRQVVITQLKRMGYLCDVAANGVEALAAIRSKHYALVLMDLQMPAMDGLEATAAIRAYEDKEDDPIRIIAMTANAMVGDRERCLAAGMDDYLAKPFRPRELEGILRRWLAPTKEAT